VSVPLKGDETTPSRWQGLEGRDNALNALRLGLAIAVAVSHALILGGVGVNEFTSDDDHPVEILKVSNDAELSQRRHMADVRARRDAKLVADRLEALKRAAEADKNVIGPMLDCARSYCTLYEIRQALERVWGAYREPVFF